jgi:hypothetical protein
VTTLSSPIRQQATPQSALTSDFRHQLGAEIAAQAKLTTGDDASLIAVDLAQLETMMPAARELAKTRNKKMRLIKLINRVDIEDNEP